jgi:ribonuclease III
MPSTTSWPGPVPDGPPGAPRDLAGLLALLDPDVRAEALTHRAWAPSRLRSYERLEFLGDAVLYMIATAALVDHHPDRSEGDLTRMRQNVVSREACAQVAAHCGLPGAMVDAAPPRHRDEAREMATLLTVKAALAESVIGAGWTAVGHDATASAVRGSFGPALAAAPDRMIDPKSALQERVQVGSATAGDVRYEITGHSGPPQDRIFLARVMLHGRHLGSGEGRSKQAAEQAAAAAALESMAKES